MVFEKTLANCKPSEWAAQTVKIRKSLEKWLSDIDSKELCEPGKGAVRVNNSMRGEEREAAIEENKKLLIEAVKKKGLHIFDKALAEHTTETLEILALICFVEPDHVDDYSIGDYWQALEEMLNDKATLSFFTLFKTVLGTIGSTAL